MINKKDLKRSLFKSAVGKYLTYAFQFVTVVTLARLYSPDLLGYFAIIQVIITFFMLMTDAGLGPALINEDNIHKRDVDGLFSCCLFLGLLLALLLNVISPLISEYYDDVMYQKDLVWVSFAIIFHMLCIIPNASLIKERKFITIANLTCLAEAISLIYLLSAYQYRPTISLVSEKFLLFSVVRFTLFYFYSKSTVFGRPSFGKNIFAINKYASFSLYQLGFNFFNFFTRNLDNLLIGRYFGLADLGYYDRAYQLMRYPLQLVTFALVPAIQPIIAKEKKVEEIINTHNWLCKRLLFIGIYLSSIIYNCSEGIVVFLFGTEWINSANILEIFALMIPVQMVMSSSGAFFQACNRVNVLFLSGLISSTFNIIAIIFGVYLGDTKYVAFMLLFSFTCNFFQTYYFLFKYVFHESVLKFYDSLKTGILLIILLTFITFLMKEYVSYEGLIGIAVRMLIITLIMFPMIKLVLRK
ncbi:oligosaccharide flippase family protein [Photobacterium halotolerans]|uniref:Polysaccharide biosynthesis protein n=1 Tax=Photobacterium halotolerans TaxID=265726 RepID=A0A0F5VH73_9GAMM|nr:oligosaccharide flippase family protein [Photobacterium halotolerans]KKD01469.1 hypothetical protein KY46_01170 [Photobacterium halotolerans]